ncbi:MAG: Glycerophosphoryl diester phosphodiesterase [uncultured Truepera sp.]|uniref:Glycerophosphoryl diester phosphodiesterase n=1 Tax=uncultured Truepera sp. TaxID=543023 RepID=A0A6J4V7K3_9DEIN|nr:MAG: Glycerophosphoryl diester phosphodiesterase [uncultured Truepera sp.]
MTIPWAVLLLVFWPFFWKPRAIPGLTPKPTLLLGHRGVRGSLPENSLAAFKAALDAGLDGLETDLQRSRDGHLVLIHDFSLPDGRSVSALNCRELQEADPKIPTLEALFVLARPYQGTLLNLELKTYGWRTGGLERAAARAIQNSGLGARVLVSSFNPISLMRLRLRAPGVRTALLYSPEGPGWLRGNRAARLFARLLHLDALHPHFSLVDAPLARWAARRGVMLNTWTVNDPQEVARLTRLNVNGLMADDPKALKDAFKEALWSLEK